MFLFKYQGSMLTSCRASAGNQDTRAVVQNFLNSLKSGQFSGGGSQTSSDPFTTLDDLLSPKYTLPVIATAPESFIDTLCANLPPTVLHLAREIGPPHEVDPNAETAQMAIDALSLGQKKDLLRRILMSPQLRQSLGSLTVALRDGGLPNISQALNLQVKNGGYMRGGGMPLGGGDAVKAFLEGAKKTVEEAKDDEEMDTS